MIDLIQLFKFIFNALSENEFSS